MPAGLVMCIRVSEYTGRIPAEIHRDQCGECHAPVLVAPSSHALLRTGAAAGIVCNRCLDAVRARQHAAGEQTVDVITEEAMTELIGLLNERHRNS